MLRKGKAGKNNIDIKIKTKHIIMFSKFFAKMEVKFNSTGKNQTELGAEIIFGVLENLYKAEKELYAIIADLSGYNVEKVENLEIKELKEILETIVTTMIDFFPELTSP